MACLQALKQDIKILESLFTSENERFRILSASVDEVTCEFVSSGDESVRINANITVSCDIIASRSYACVLPTKMFEL